MLRTRLYGIWRRIIAWRFDEHRASVFSGLYVSDLDDGDIMFLRNVGSRLDSDVANVPGKKMDPQADLD